MRVGVGVVALQQRELRGEPGGVELQVPGVPVHEPGPVEPVGQFVEPLGFQRLQLGRLGADRIGCGGDGLAAPLAGTAESVAEAAHRAPMLSPAGRGAKARCTNFGM